MPMSRTNELSILIASTGSCLQVRKRRVAGAEVVDRKAHAQLAQAIEQRRLLFDVLHEVALGELELEGAPARCRRAAQRRLDRAVEALAVDHLAHRRFTESAQPRLHALRCHARTCRQAASSTHSPMGTMRPESSATSMNLSGHRAARGADAASGSAPRRRPARRWRGSCAAGSAARARCAAAPGAGSSRSHSRSCARVFMSAEKNW